ncbi:hypothetical protein ABI59_01040 [Acidobacteria bacterium Mor1]|nr:hypothetical protein ABI59_01040 [Acidobacteria bacterium Mor1]
MPQFVRVTDPSERECLLNPEPLATIVDKGKYKAIYLVSHASGAVRSTHHEVADLRQKIA